MRARPIAAFAAALALVTGCSTGGPPRPTAAAQPSNAAQPPNRALVAWSDAMCLNVRILDGLGSYADSSYYAAQVLSDVEAVLTELDRLDSSGVQQADSYVAELTRDLERLRDELPGTEQPDKARVTELVGEFGTQRPTLDRIAERSRTLAPSYHLAPSCTALKPAPELATRATRKLVRWADTMCEGLRSITALPEPGNELIEDPRFAHFEDTELSSYLTSVPSAVSSIVEPLAGLPKTGIAEADDYRSRLISSLRDAGARLPDDVSAVDLYDLPIEQLRGRARETADVIAGIRPEGPELSGIAGEHSALADSYELAPGCTPPGAKESAPTTTLPPARDRADVGACQDGTCQIEVSDPVDVTVHDNVFTIAVSEGTVWIVDGSSLIKLFGEGTAQFGTGSTAVVFEVVASTETAAVLDVSTR